MPRTYPPRRTLIGVRLAPAGVAEIDAQAKAEGVDRSTMMRTLIAEALAARNRTIRPARGQGYRGGVPVPVAPIRHAPPP